MRVAPPALFPLFRSELQSRILARVLLAGADESVADLAVAIEEDPGNTAREVIRLERAGILTSRRVGRTKLVSANSRAPFYRALVELVTIAKLIVTWGSPYDELAERKRFHESEWLSLPPRNPMAQ